MRRSSSLLLAQGLLALLQKVTDTFTLLAVASGAIWTPLDVLKSRLQTGREGTSAVALTRKILHEEGAIGLMKGYWLGTAIFVCVSASLSRALSSSGSPSGGPAR